MKKQELSAMMTALLEFGNLNSKNPKGIFANFLGESLEGRMMFIEDSVNNLQLLAFVFSAIAVFSDYNQKDIKSIESLKCSYEKAAGHQFLCGSNDAKDRRNVLSVLRFVGYPRNMTKIVKKALKKIKESGLF